MRTCQIGKTLGVGDRQGDLACCGPWGCKEPDKTERVNENDLVSHNGDWCSCIRGREMEVVMEGFLKEAEQTQALQSRAGKHCYGTEGLCPPNSCMQTLISSGMVSGGGAGIGVTRS